MIRASRFPVERESIIIHSFIFRFAGKLPSSFEKAEATVRCLREKPGDKNYSPSSARKSLMGRSAGLPVSSAVREARMVSVLVASMAATGSEKEISSR